MTSSSAESGSATSRDSVRPSLPVNVTTPSRAVTTARAPEPTKEYLPIRSDCSADSSRKAGPSPRSFVNSESGVSLSATNSTQTGTTEWEAASRANSSGEGNAFPKRDASDGVAVVMDALKKGA